MYMTKDRISPYMDCNKMRDWIQPPDRNVGSIWWLGRPAKKDLTNSGTYALILKTIVRNCS